MGRYYYGNITGKFWFAVQSSSPMKQFGAVELKSRIEYLVCGCGCEFDGDAPSDNAYCSECYESHEQHLAEVVEQEADDEITETWRANEGCGEWEFAREDFELNGIAFINQHQEFFDRHVASITFNKEDSYDYDFEYTEGGDPLTKEEDELLADLCMLKQIQKFFDENPDEDSCDWEAEY